MSEKKHNSEQPLSVGDLEKQLLSKRPNLFEDLTEEKKEKILESIREILYSEVRQEITKISMGPLPVPEDLKGYAEIKQEYADTIVQMAFDNLKYIHSRDIKIIEKSFFVKGKGQNFALIITIVAIVGGVICILFGHEISGTILSGVGLTSLISEFLEKSFFDRFLKRNESNPKPHSE